VHEPAYFYSEVEGNGSIITYGYQGRNTDTTEVNQYFEVDGILAPSFNFTKFT
tara:strand:+ start:355 stop:513 length:159 start_codon:yes stop_codon:yes gene_type:complete